MAGLADLLEAYKNYRGVQEWKRGKEMEESDYRSNMPPGTMERAMNLWGGFDTGGLAGAIKSYHGAPRLTPFTKFDKKFLSSGEGTQYEGRGHYVAEDPISAKYYAEMGNHPMFMDDFTRGLLESAKNSDRLLRDDFYKSLEHHVAHEAVLGPGKTFEKSLSSLLNKYNRELATRQKWLEKAQQNPNNYQNAVNIPHYFRLINDYNEKIKALNNLMSNKSLSEQVLNDINTKTHIASGTDPQSSIYEVSLEWPGARESVDPMSREHFLQWDLPFEQQPENIKNILTQIASEDKKYKGLLGNAPGEAVKKLKLEDLLYERGIPGNAYLNYKSKGTVPGAESAYNYVIFGDEIPRILSHNKPSVLDMLWPDRPK